MSACAVPLIDSHCHLQASAFAGMRSAVQQRAQGAGIRYLVCNGTMEEDWPDVFALAQASPTVVPCFGLHPWYVARKTSGWLSHLEHFLDAIPAAVGEIGLDQWITPRDEAAQELTFRAQLDLARRKHRPVMVHCLHAWAWLMRVLREDSPLPGGLLLHAYGGPLELIEPLTAWGAYFSFAGNVLEPKRHRQRAVLRQMPRDRLLL